MQREQGLDASALEPHFGVIAHLDRFLAHDERDARYDQHDHGHDGRDQEFFVCALQVKPDDGQLGYSRGEVTPESSASVVIRAVLTEFAYERVAFAPQGVHAALQIDV